MNTFLQRRILGRIVMAAALFVGLAGALVRPAVAADEAPDALVQRLTSDVLDTIRNDKSIRAGDVDKIMQLVDAKIMPNINFQRMTSSAVGPAWRRASPEQKKRLEEEFKGLLVRTYAGAIDKVTDQAISIKPMRNLPDDKEVLVRTEVRGGGNGSQPVQIDYRLEKSPDASGGWKIYNLNVMGVWLVDTYRTQFAQEINANGIDGLIDKLVTLNKNSSANANGGAQK